MGSSIFLNAVLVTLSIVGVNSALDPNWWKNINIYQIYPRSFKDSDGDGIGDLKGIESKLQYIKDSHYDAFWVSPIYPSPQVDFGYDISNFTSVDDIYGGLEALESLTRSAHKIGLRVILDFVPNHVSYQHEWFKKSIKKIEPYTDYFIWKDGKMKDGVRVPPNNWVNTFIGPAWTWNEERQQYFYHVFTPSQPDLNYHNPKVVEEMKNTLRFWLERGIDGFRMDALPHIVEDPAMPDEPVSGDSDDPNQYAYLNHIYSKCQPGTYEVLKGWRKTCDEYNKSNNYPIIFVEAYAEMDNTMKFYKAGANFPFNFGFVNELQPDLKAKDYKNLIDRWMKNMPAGSTPNWVIGNHDNSRTVGRVGRDMAMACITITQLMPGVSVMFNGEELGMDNMHYTWEQTVDPQGCNAGPENFDKVSRDICRSPFQWDNTTSAGFSTNENTWLPVNPNYVDLNLEAEKVDPKSYYNYYLKVNRLRNLSTRKDGKIQTILLNDDVLLVVRKLLKVGQRNIYILVNVSDRDQTVNLKKLAPGALELYVASKDFEFEEGAIINSNDDIKIPARATGVFFSA